MDSLARGIGSAHRRYSRLINARTGASGHLFQARFYSYPIQADSHLLASVRYVELNPVFAGLASRPEEYPWSSARYHLSGSPDPLTTASQLLTELAPDWRAFLTDGVRLAADRERIERHLASGYPLGNDKWAHAIGEDAGFHYPPNPRGRPARQS
jgi:putative transposase